MTIATVEDISLLLINVSSLAKIAFYNIRQNLLILGKDVFREPYGMHVLTKCSSLKFYKVKLKI